MLRIGRIGSEFGIASFWPLVPVRMTVPHALPPLPAAVEVAAYRIALEALANVLAHAGARSCRLRVTHDGDRLLLEVDDDGRGIGRVGRNNDQTAAKDSN